jgi:hypothetical protein
MNQTITIDIINDKAIELLEDLEQKKLIRFHKEKIASENIDWISKYKGAMTKQPLKKINKQLDDLRLGWE